MSTRVTTRSAKNSEVGPTVVERLAIGMRAAASSLSTYWSLTQPSFGTVRLGYRDTVTAIHKQDPKRTEARRQINRLRSLVETDADDLHSPYKESVESAVKIIEKLLEGPIPIHVASRGSDFGTTLFFQEPNFYADIEIKDNDIDFFIRHSKQGEEIEVYCEEKIEGGHIPPKLLSALYRQYLR